MISFLRTLFAWPQGIVVGNLIASALWAAPALGHLHWLQARRHRELTGGSPAAAAAIAAASTRSAPIVPARLTWDNPKARSRPRLRLTGG